MNYSIYILKQKIILLNINIIIHDKINLYLRFYIFII